MIDSSNFLKNEQLAIDGKKLKKCMYNIDLKILNVEEDPIEIEYGKVVSLSIEKNYNTSYFPILKIEFFTSSKYHFMILEKKNYVKFDITLKKFEEEMFEKKVLNVEEAGKEIDPRELNYEVMFNAIFVPMVQDNPPQKRQMMEEASGTLDGQKLGSEGEDIGDGYKNEFYIFPEKALSQTKKVHNMLFKDITVSGMLGYLYNESQVDSLLISKIDNTKTYKQGIIPPLTLPNAIDYIHNYYGIFNTGVRRFNDIDMSYLLNYSLDEIPVALADEYEDVLINIMDMTDPRMLNEGCYTDTEKKTYMINATNDFKTINNSQTDTEINGTKTVFLNPKNIKYGTSADDSGNLKFGGGSKAVESLNDGYDADDKITYIYNSVENDTLELEYMFKGRFSNQAIMIQMRDMNYNFFKLNRRYVLFFENVDINSKYGGVYLLQGANFLFVRLGNELAMQMGCQILLSQVDTIKYEK